MSAGVVRLFSALALVFWAGALLLVPEGTYWRDSGEFILSAFYLDIAHPAGFPLFAQLSNLFALLPFGPIAWRVGIFCALLAVAASVAVACLSYVLIRRQTTCGELSAGFLSISAAAGFSSSISFLRQATTTEVYVLHCFAVTVFLLIYERFTRSGDVRLILLLCFLAGLAIGNHVVMGLVAFPAAVVIATHPGSVRRALLPGLVLGVLGLSIYAYLPVRSLHSLPLNTGEPSTLNRFIDHVTDARDRELRKGDIRSLDASFVHLKALPSSTFLKQLRGDARRITEELSAPVFYLGLIGLLLVCWKTPRLGLVMLISGAVSWLFFLGWDPDPWMPLFALLCVGTSVCLASVMAILRHSPAALGGACFAVSILWIGMSAVRIAKANPSAIPEFDTPTAVAVEQLQGLPRSSVLLTEPSWFLFTYAQAIEGVRPDVSLVYQPSIMFPEYFARVKLADSQGNLFDSWNAKHEHGSELPNLARFVSFVAARAPLSFEPSRVTNHFFSSVAQCDTQRFPYLTPGRNKNVDPACIDAMAGRLNSLKAAIAGSPGWTGHAADSAHYFEMTLTGSADLLALLAGPQAGAKLFRTVCQPLEEPPCGLTSLNNLAALHLDAQEYLEAASVLVVLINRGFWDMPAVQKNLQQALTNLEENAVEKILNGVSDQTLRLKLRALAARE